MLGSFTTILAGLLAVGLGHTLLNVKLERVDKYDQLRTEIVNLEYEIKLKEKANEELNEMLSEKLWASIIEEYQRNKMEKIDLDSPLFNQILLQKIEELQIKPSGIDSSSSDSSQPKSDEKSVVMY